MARHFLQSTRPLVSVVRNNIEIFATLAAIVAGALVPLPSPSGAMTTSTRMERPPNLSRSDFRFRLPQEMVAGEWIFEFRHKGVLLCQKQFRVVTE